MDTHINGMIDTPDGSFFIHPANNHLNVFVYDDYFDDCVNFFSR